MSRPPRPLPEILGDAFRVSEALRQEVSAERLRDQDLEHPFRGVVLRRVDAPIDERRGEPLAIDRLARRAVMRRVHAYAVVMPSHAFFAGRTAAVAWKLPVDHHVAGEDELCVGVHAPVRPLKAQGIRGVKLSPALVKVREREGLRVTSPSSTWAMLASELTVRELVILGDAIVRVPRDGHGTPRPERQLATIEQLSLATDAPWRRERSKLRAALSHIRVGSMSPLETDFRLGASAAGLPEPDLDVEIHDRAGCRLGISDAVYPAYRTVVEVEGDHHRTARSQWNRDIEKYAAYSAEGWEVVRLTAQHIRGPRPEAAGIVRAVLQRRGWRL